MDGLFNSSTPLRGFKGNNKLRHSSDARPSGTGDAVLTSHLARFGTFYQGYVL